MTAAPLVSVLLPVYNAGPYLAAALGSILPAHNASRVSVRDALAYE